MPACSIEYCYILRFNRRIAACLFEFLNCYSDIASIGAEVEKSVRPIL